MNFFAIEKIFVRVDGITEPNSSAIILIQAAFSFIIAKSLIYLTTRSRTGFMLCDSIAKRRYCEAGR